jgi:pimeloyl-ACP methyl ester carboxylesterase
MHELRIRPATVSKLWCENEGFSGSAMPSTHYDDQLKTVSIAHIKDGPNDDLGPCGFFWLGGFMSDMTGSKAEALADLARSQRRTSLRFDYSGHGQSSGLFVDGTISQWLEEATHMFLAHTRNKRIIVGSSMGGWLAQLLARRLKQDDPSAYRRIGGMVLLAPATDMTLDLMWDRFDKDQKQEMADHGVVHQPSHYGNPYAITLKLIEDGATHRILDKGLDVPFPVRILQGTEDVEVPPAHAFKTFEALRGPDVTLNYIKDGDHRLSTPGNLRLLRETVLQLAERADGGGV